ncbi:unnamed protein product, partial [Rangifer tarandus platyrhynchus]
YSVSEELEEGPEYQEDKNHTVTPVPAHQTPDLGRLIKMSLPTVPPVSNTPGFPVHHQLPKLAQTHNHRVSDAIQPFHLLSSPSSPAFNLFQHQGLFQGVSSLHQLEADIEQQFSSVAQSCPTLCDPMDCCAPDFPIHHQLPELTQIHAHQVGDAIQPSCPLLSPSPPTLNIFQHRGLFQEVSSLHQVGEQPNVYMIARAIISANIVTVICLL